MSTTKSYINGRQDISIVRIIIIESDEEEPLPDKKKSK